MSRSAGLRFVLDQGIPRDAATRLREAGYECTHVGEIGMSTASDEAILAFAEEKNAVVVTLDADFHAILAVFSKAAPSVIRLRLQGLNANAVAGLVLDVVASFALELERGCMVTLKAHKTTCHRLPIGDAPE